MEVILLNLLLIVRNDGPELIEKFPSEKILELKET